MFVDNSLVVDGVMEAENSMLTMSFKFKVEAVLSKFRAMLKTSITLQYKNNY